MELVNIIDSVLNDSMKRKNVKASYITEAIKVTKDIKTKFKMSESQIARLLDIPEKTFNAWLNGTIRCRHDKMLCLSLNQIFDRLK